MKKRYCAISLLLLALGLAAAPVRAESPTAYVRGILEKVLAIQNNPALAGEARKPERAQAIRQVIKQSFDFPFMAQDSLGPTYGRLGAAQRREFTETFSYLFQDSYTRLVLNYLKQETVNYQGETLADGRARVKTSLLRTNETIPVEYLLHRQGQGWVLYDVIVDGVSILEHYRTEFARVMRTHSFDYLLNKMKTQRRASP
jgi:phospholipid transport system substrate-binding protein